MNNDDSGEADRKKCFVSGRPAGPIFFEARTGGTENLISNINMFSEYDFSYKVRFL